MWEIKFLLFIFLFDPIPGGFKEFYSDRSGMVSETFLTEKHPGIIPNTQKEPAKLLKIGDYFFSKNCYWVAAFFYKISYSLKEEPEESLFKFLNCTDETVFTLKAKHQGDWEEFESNGCVLKDDFFDEIYLGIFQLFGVEITRGGKYQPRFFFTDHGLRNSILRSFPNSKWSERVEFNMITDHGYIQGALDVVKLGEKFLKKFPKSTKKNEVFKNLSMGLNDLWNLSKRPEHEVKLHYPKNFQEILRSGEVYREKFLKYAIPENFDMDEYKNIQERQPTRVYYFTCC